MPFYRRRLRSCRRSLLSRLRPSQPPQYIQSLTWPSRPATGDRRVLKPDFALFRMSDGLGLRAICIGSQLGAGGTAVVQALVWAVLKEVAFSQSLIWDSVADWLPCAARHRARRALSVSTSSGAPLRSLYSMCLCLAPQLLLRPCLFRIRDA